MTHRVGVLDQGSLSATKMWFRVHKILSQLTNQAQIVSVLNEESKKAQIDEEICNGCGICVKVCPFDAITIVNLASELATDKIHQYGQNSFRLLQTANSKKRRGCRFTRKKWNGQKYSSKYSIR